MQIDFVCGSLSRNSGGIFEIAQALSQSLAERENDVTVLGHEDEFWSLDKNRWKGVTVKAMPTQKFFGYNWCGQLTKELLVSKARVTHLHGLWTHGSFAVAHSFLKTRRPFIVSLHGMLEPWALQNSKWKKKLAWLACERSLLRNCACLHANTLKELSDIRRLQIEVPVAVIPNGVTPPLPRPKSPPSPVKILLYLGRIHPKKGIENLVRAWGMPDVRKQLSNWRLVIAGWNQENHLTELTSIAKSCNLRFWVNDGNDVDNRTKCKLENLDIAFLGPIFENTKRQWLDSATAFILPSHSEGLPMSVLEAWSHELPCLITPQCNLPEGIATAAAIEIESSPYGIARGLHTLSDMSEERLKQMGSNGLHLVNSRYTWQIVASQFDELYRWLISGSTPPDFVHFSDKS